MFRHLTSTISTYLYFNLFRNELGSLLRITISNITHKFVNENQTDMNELCIETTGGATTS